MDVMRDPVLLPTGKGGERERKGRGGEKGKGALERDTTLFVRRRFLVFIQAEGEKKRRNYEEKKQPFLFASLCALGDLLACRRLLS